MDNWAYNLLVFIFLWTYSYMVYLACNHGLAPNARLQQLIRYLVGSLVAVTPLFIVNTYPLQPAILLSLIVSLSWIITYPLLYHLTNRKFAPDYDHQIDEVFGLYLFGMLTSLLMLPICRWIVGIVIFIFFFVCVVQWCYYLICDTCIDARGMKMLQETHYNEILEFLRSYSFIYILLICLGLILIAIVCVCIPLLWPVFPVEVDIWCTTILMIIVLSIMWYMFKLHHGLVSRIGVVQLFITVREYVKNNARYIDMQQKRLNNLDVRSITPMEEAHTILLVIGESASRDFMSAFTPITEDTTPWLRTLSEDEHHCILFPNAYSCDIQTVPTLERALTECNQYDDGEFYQSCSIVDIARKLGYRVHWYSNQGHLGAADTPVTLVANTADVAKWTRQELGKPQYDETLLDFLDEIDPTQRNVVVLHLKGSHFNYENRFKESTRQWGAPKSHDKITNYKNTLYYTDTVLRSFYEYSRSRLNLQAMIYCSDHADVPDRHRQPNIGGFRDLRIPLMVWLSDEFQNLRPRCVEALRTNRTLYWTNDLLYDLFCGLLDIESNHFHVENSLTSLDYRFTREQLIAMGGKIRIAEDEN
ncbi:MAG: phosphoethanolamine transferase [Prevotellaceae bacterium]|nr:phosphoethanolamine transferase [Prevotellaceae bacterium]